jgi:hypothetical protein
MRGVRRDAEIVPENIDAVAVIYVAWQLEQAGVFQVVDSGVELWSAGVRPGATQEIIMEGWGSESRSRNASHTLTARRSPTAVPRPGVRAP